MDNVELGNKYIRFGKLLKNNNAKLSDLVAAAADCGLVFSIALTPSPDKSEDVVVEDIPQTAFCPR